MRHIRTRRRFKVILILLLIACFTIFVENRVEGLIPQLKSLAEAKVEDALGGKVNFSIGSIDGGVIHPIVLNDIRIAGKDISQLIDSLVIDSIRTNYYIRDIVMAIGGAELAPLLNKNSSAHVNFSMKNGCVKGFIGLYGDLSDAKVDGCVILSTGLKVNFSGRIKDGKFDAEVRSDGLNTGAIRVSGVISAEGISVIDIKFDHLKVYGFDIACDAVLKNEIIKSADPSVQSRIAGEFETRNMVLNFKPFAGIKAKYEITRSSVEVTDFNLGEVIKAYGRVSLIQPRRIDLTLLANNVSLSWLMLSFGKKEAASALTGTMNGKFEFNGPIGKVHASSNINIKSGTMTGLNFDYLTATLKGELPFLRIEDSRITRNSGYFSIAGEFDLRRVGKDSIFDDIKLVTDDTAITWDEWNSTEGANARELNMKKNIGSQFGFGYKKFVTEDKIGESLRDSDEVQFNYNLQANNSLKVMVAQDKDFVGFEHKDKF